MNKEETHYKIRKLIKSYEKRHGNINESKAKITEPLRMEGMAIHFEIDTLNAEESLIEEFINDLKGLIEDE